MKKKILTLILLIITTVLVFASCNDSDDSAVRYTSATDSSSYILDIDTAALTFDLEITTSAGTQTVNGSYTTDSVTGIVTLTYTENDTTKYIYITLDTANAIFSLLTYTVTWKSQDGSETYETDTNVLYGAVPDYGGETPVKSLTAQYGYTFSGWSSGTGAESGTAEEALAAVTGDVTYYAAFAKSVNAYTLTFASNNTDYGTVSTASIENVPYGSVIAVNGTNLTINGAAVTASATADNAEYDYAFSSWSIANGDTVTGAMTIMATFTRSAAKFIYAYEVSGGDATIIGYEADDYIKGNLIIPSEIDGYTVTGIGSSAFSESLMTDVTIPSTVTNIGAYAFSSCLELTSITIPSTVTSIGDNVFYGSPCLVHIRNCSGITVSSSAPIGAEIITAEGPFINTLTEDGNGVIIYIINDSESEFFGKVYLFGYTGESAAPDLSAYTSITDVYPYAFSESTLTGITLPDSVTSIGEYAFAGCRFLTDMELPSSLLTIGNCAFQSCTKLSAITIPEGVVTIGDGIFTCCSSLVSVSIPSTVTAVGNRIFGACYKLVQIINCSSITVSSDASIGVETVTTAEGAFTNTLYIDADGVITYTVGEKVYLMGYTGNDTALDLSEYEVTDIYPRAFYDSQITGIILPDSLTSIGESAFYYCFALANVTMPDSLASIGSYAFYNCSRLTSVTIPSSVTFIGINAFAYCYALTEVTFENIDGWYYTSDPNASSGTPIDVSVASDNAAELKLDSYMSPKYYKRMSD